MLLYDNTMLSEKRYSFGFPNVNDAREILSQNREQVLCL